MGRNKSLIGAAILFTTRIAMGKEYLFSESTLGDKLAAGTGLSVHCFGCQRRAVLDVAELVRRLGPDHGCMHWDLLKVLYCHECRGAGRDDRNLQFTNHALTPEKRKGWTPCP
ncbi:MAG: hypothetical protein EOS81_23590 [Mesorhizobium sp.]|uniref:hypothetical protein n=2 Tax=Mesorhizobium TaxID=68287 RepID=UPI000F756441|nr:MULTISPECIES: hypothetical protein [unclassified Mesorhizobium]RUY12678.1 hypothetical protein EOA25_02680 [Mesorhizobium sp. M2A.F.Ca.ET.040.01.1.1]RVC67376.1 hypothetical protein EN759_15580 [Mesorhizobium sp. M00.F.Ca.ET.038.03.1.1]RVC79350.1 hypothetical protein EN766_07510 [Mesorhizobium sp. M2A.F.Ca.ET.046.02.1.1]AZO33904.1 hypothetical protein EJ072_04750 [Mesorhizobium sp. M2A.F.Ca.ET.046.03.2.1]RWA91456.1 MAG: hypothetical protein EOQ31_09940 [Mesorhizobium sp.]